MQFCETDGMDNPTGFDPARVPRPANTYVLEEGDTPYTVAEELYGNGNRGGELVRKNVDVAWLPGAIITLL